MTGFYIRRREINEQCSIQHNIWQIIQKPTTYSNPMENCGCTVLREDKYLKGGKDIFAYMNKCLLNAILFVNWEGQLILTVSCWRLSLHKSEETGPLNTTDKTVYTPSYHPHPVQSSGAWQRAGALIRLHCMDDEKVSSSSYTEGLEQRRSFTLYST